MEQRGARACERARVISPESKRESNKRAEFRIEFESRTRKDRSVDINFHLTVESIMEKKEWGGKKRRKVSSMQSRRVPPISATLPTAEASVPTRERTKCNHASRKFPSKLDYPRSPQRRKKRTRPDLTRNSCRPGGILIRGESNANVYFA